MIKDLEEAISGNKKIIEEIRKQMEENK